MANIAYIQVTRKCNQKCRFCSNPPTSKKEPLGFFYSLIDRYVEERYSGVILSGGEPTLYPKLAELISYAEKKLLPSRIITNGQKLADIRYFKRLKDAGLKHICLSVYSDDSKVQASLSKNKSSLSNIKKTLDNAARLNITTNIITVINKYNAPHLDRIVKWLVEDYPFISHFVWNNLDPLMNRASRNKDTIPSLSDFEVSLNLAMKFLQQNKKSFRVERVPLCYMAEFAHSSTETRKIVKEEKRLTYFLDEKELFQQNKWHFDKAPCCKVCTFNDICAGLYQMGKYFSSSELYPLFLDKNEVIRKIRSGR